MEGGQSSWVDTDTWGRGGAELQKHRLFYFCKVVLLVLCLTMQLQQKQLFACHKAFFKVYYKILYGTLSLLEYEVIQKVNVS